MTWWRWVLRRPVVKISKKQTLFRLSHWHLEALYYHNKAKAILKNPGADFLFRKCGLSFQVLRSLIFFPIALSTDSVVYTFFFSILLVKSQMTKIAIWPYLERMVVCLPSIDKYWYCETSGGDRTQDHLLKITWQNEMVEKKGKIEKKEN